MQVHYEGIHRIDPETGERAEVVDELQEAVVQCLDCMHDQPHLGFHNGRVEPIEDRWERMIAGTPWVASCTVTVDADDVETCSGPEAGDALSYAAFGDHGTREFFTHVRFHKHDDDNASSSTCSSSSTPARPRRPPTCSRRPPAAAAITSLAEESRPPAAAEDRPLAAAPAVAAAAGSSVRQVPEHPGMMASQRASSWPRTPRLLRRMLGDVLRAQGWSVLEAARRRTPR